MVFLDKINHITGVPSPRDFLPALTNAGELVEQPCWVLFWRSDVCNQIDTDGQLPDQRIAMSRLFQLSSNIGVCSSFGTTYRFLTLIGV